MKRDILQQIPFKAINIPSINRYYEVKLQFRRPVKIRALSDPWNLSCEVGEIFTHTKRPLNLFCVA